MTPFDIINSVTHNKKRIIDSNNEKEYTAFMVNRGLSNFIDTIVYAQEMNVNHQLDPLLQYDYHLHSIRPKKRFSKWHKKVKDEDLEAVMKYYSYNRNRALEVMKILTKDQIATIKERFSE